MKPVKYSFSEAEKVDLGTKIIYKYPTPTKDIDVAKMVLNGRHPKGSKTFVIEHTCSFIMSITKGKGTVYAGDEKFTVGVGDVIFVPKENKFAVEGKLEYTTIDTPAYFREQTEIIEA